MCVELVWSLGAPFHLEQFYSRDFFVLPISFSGLAPPSGLQLQLIFSQQNNSSQSLIYEFLGF